jgi:CO/xanthine dehydrogenase Mo-binding subunit
MAVDRKGISNTGAFASTTMITMNKCTLIGAGPYRVPNHRAETFVVYTNKCRSAAFRGFGMSQPTFAIEVMMDAVAEKLGMDRLEFRMKNLMKDGDRAATGQAMRAVGIQACLEKVAEMSGWNTSER